MLLALYSHFYLKEQLGRREWLSIFLCFAGTLLLAVTLVPRDWGQTDIEWIQVWEELPQFNRDVVVILMIIFGRAASHAPSSPFTLSASMRVQVKLGLVLMLALPLLGMLEVGARRAKRASADRSVIELLAGVQVSSPTPSSLPRI